MMVKTSLIAPNTYKDNGISTSAAAALGVETLSLQLLAEHLLAVPGQSRGAGVAGVLLQLLAGAQPGQYPGPCHLEKPEHHRGSCPKVES